MGIGILILLFLTLRKYAAAFSDDLFEGVAMNLKLALKMTF